MNYSQLKKMVLAIEKGPGDFSDEMEVLFNPNQISINKATNWSSHPTLDSDTGNIQGVVSQPANLDVDLFFDTYEQQSDVRQFTNKLYSLTTIEKQIDIARPPLCRITWGDFDLSDDYNCEWALQNLSQRFTLFLGTGIPVRATLTCSFKQWRDPRLEAAMQNTRAKSNTKVETIKENQTLSDFSQKNLGDSRRWSEIAEENNIASPRKIEPGTRLSVSRNRSVEAAQNKKLNTSFKRSSVSAAASRQVELPSGVKPSVGSSGTVQNGAGGGSAKPRS